MQDINDLFNIGAEPDPMQLMSVANQGQQALDSGAVSKKAAKAAQKKLGLDTPEKTQDFLSKYLGADDGKNPYVFGPSAQSGPTPYQQPGSMPAPMLNPAQMPNPAGVKPGQRGAQIKSQQTATQDVGSKQTRNVYDGANDIMDMAMNRPEIQSQVAGLKAMDDQYASLAAKSTPDDAWIKTLLAYGDSMNGTHMADSFNPQGAKKAADLQKFANEIQQRKGDFSKLVLDTVAKMKTGSDQATSDKKLNELLMLGIGNNGQSGIADVRRQNAIVAAGAAYDKDPMVKQMQGTNNSLQRAIGIMDGKTPVTGKNFALLQQDMINAMAPGGAATEGKVNREMVETLAAKLNDIKTQFGNISDLRKDQPQVFAQLRGLIQQVKKEYNEAYSRKIGDIKKNYDHVTDADIKNTAYEKADHLLGQLTTGELAPPSTPPPKKDYHAMSDAEIEAEIAARSAKKAGG